MNGGGDGDDGGLGEWSDTVEDLVDIGDVDVAISDIEFGVSMLEINGATIGDIEFGVSMLEIEDPPPPADDIRVATVLNHLADVHSSRGHSLEADKLRSRALFYLARAVNPPSQNSGRLDREELTVKDSEREESSASASSRKQEEGADDSKTIADRGAANGVLLSSQDEAGVPPSASAGDKETGGLKRQGRGPNVDITKADAREHQTDDGIDEVKNCEDLHARYDTSHILVLYDLPPSTRIVKLKKLFERFQDSGVTIRRVTPSVAVAVFSTPSAALEAQHSIQCPFKVRALGEDDDLLSALAPKDLDPPHPRPNA